MDRKFGIEMEIAGINRETALRALRAVGINVQDEGYNHTTRRHWKLVSDASVRGGFEVERNATQGLNICPPLQQFPAKTLDRSPASILFSLCAGVLCPASEQRPAHRALTQQPCDHQE